MVKTLLCIDNSGNIVCSKKLCDFFDNQAFVSIDNIMNNISEFITDPLILQGVIDELRNARDRGMGAFLDAVKHDLGE